MFVAAAEANEPAPAAAALAATPVAGASDAAHEAFLDRLMSAESGGRDTAANPRSTALGAFQFIKSTFVIVARTHFTREVGELTDQQILELRTNRHFSRRAAGAYSRQNAAYLSDQGLRPNFGHLRLAFLLGPYGAARLIKAEPGTSVSSLLSAAAVRANPFMRRLTAADLIARTRNDVDGRPTVVAAKPATHPEAEAPAARHAPAPRCNQKLASCRRWVALNTTRKPAKHTITRKPAAGV